MTQILSARADKHEVIDLIEQIFDRHIYVGLNATQRLAVRDYLLWMRTNNNTFGVLHNNTKLEIEPNPQILRITLEYSFDPIPPWEVKQH